MRPGHHGATGDAAVLRAGLRKVYWIGGGSGAGKSTIARRIADHRGLAVYSSDDAMSDHAGRYRAPEAPLLTTFRAMDMDERWVHRSPQVMLDSFHWFQGELFSLIVEDLLRLAAESAVIAEGFRLLPRLVEPLLSASGHAVWLLPTPQFRRAAFVSRNSLWQIAGKTSSPETALANLLARDQMFTGLLREETKRLDLPAIEVSTGMTEDDLAERVSQVLAFQECG